MLLEDRDTHGKLVFTDDASIQGIPARTKVATSAEVNSVLEAVTVAYQSANLAIRPKGNSYVKAAVAKALYGLVVTLRRCRAKGG
jgi:hypothetical protein